MKNFALDMILDLIASRYLDCLGRTGLWVLSGAEVYTDDSHDTFIAYR